MKSNFLLRRVLIPLALLAGAAVAPAYDLIRGPGGALVTWSNGTIPLVIRMPQTPTFQDGTNYATSVQAAIAAWNPHLANVQLSGQVVAPGAAADNGLNEIVLASQIYGDDVNPPEDFGPNVLAVTLSYRSGSPRGDGSYQRLESDILFNTGIVGGWDSYRGNLQYPEDIRRVAIHELGHLLGLDHPDEDGQSVAAIMNSTVSNTDALKIDDVTGAQFQYGRPGGFTSHLNNAFLYARPIILSNNSVTILWSNVGASKEPNEPNHGHSNDGASVWWNWVAPTNGTLTVNTFGSHFDTVLAAYTGEYIHALTQLAANDDASDYERRSSITFNVTAGTTYMIAVGGWAAEWGSITLNLSFAPSGIAPSITAHPANQSVVAGQSAQFSVAASGTPAPSYQWQRLSAAGSAWENLVDGGNYSGATGAILTVSGATLGMNGDRFRCLASNSTGTGTSAEATLTVLASLEFLQRPLTRSLLVGQSATFTVSVTGQGGLSYQWRRNGQVVAGATGSTHTLNNATLDQGGYYEVVVTSSAGTQAKSVFYVHIAEPNRAVAGWGYNDYGQTVPPAGLGSVVQVAGGVTHSIALQADGTVKGWSSSNFPAAKVPAGLSDIVAIAAAGNLSMALRADGTVAVWTYDSNPARAVPNSLQDVVAIAAGHTHALALKADGTVVTWGVLDFNVPTWIPDGLRDVVAISAGNNHSVALRSDQTVVTWGGGEGAAAPPAGLNGVIAIAAGTRHNLALRNDGTVVSWGSNEVGALTVPAAATDVRAIAAGSGFSLALKTDGSVVAWGNNFYGQTNIPSSVASVPVTGLGDGDSHVLALVPYLAPTIVTQPTNQSVIGGQSLIFSIAVEGRPRPAIRWRRNGQDLDNGGRISGADSTTLRITQSTSQDEGTYDVVVTNDLGTLVSNAVTGTVITPPSLPSPLRSRLVEAGSALVLDATAVGGVTYSWQKNGTTLVHNGAQLTIGSATPADNGTYVVTIANSAGWIRRVFHVRVAAEGGIVMWGANDRGQRQVPPNLTSLADVNAGGAHVLALRGDGTVVAWGSNEHGQATPPPGLTGVVQISAGTAHSLALKADGTVVAWGRNESGQCNVPAGLIDVVQVSAGETHSVALKHDGTVVAWGGNESGQSQPPVDLEFTSEVDAGQTHNVAMTFLGLRGWGSNAFGQINFDRETYAAAFRAGAGFTVIASRSNGEVYTKGGLFWPPNLNQVTHLAAGATHVLALRADGTVTAFGSNTAGERTVPSIGNVRQLAAGAGFSLALVESIPPRIVAQPQDRIALAGSTVELAVVANSVTTYQWLRNGEPVSDGGAVSGSQTATLRITGAQPTHAGEYRVRVTNAFGETLSLPATLAVDSLLLTINPAAAGNADASSVTVGVTTSAAGPVTYQWYFGESGDTSTPLDGATAAMLTVPQRDAADHYWVRASGGGVTRDSATITLGKWARVDPLFGSAELSATASAAGVHVVVGQAAGYSTDGVNWKPASLASGADLRVVVHDGTRFVAGGVRGQVYASGDGRSWLQLRAAQPGEYDEDVLTSYAEGNGVRVFVGAPGKVLISTDGFSWNWSPITDGNAFVNFNAVAFAAGRFVAVGHDPTQFSGPRIYQSTDGVNWARCTLSLASSHPSYSFGALRHVFFRNGSFIALGYSNYTSAEMWGVTSTDGLNWSAPAFSNRPLEVGTVQSLGGLLVHSSLVTSPDGFTWSAPPAGAPARVKAVGHGGGVFLAVISNYLTGFARLQTSTDLSTWTTQVGFGVPALVTRGADRFAAVSRNLAGYSFDGTRWTIGSVSLPHNLQGIAHGGGLFLVCETDSSTPTTHYTSTDGLTWTAQNGAPQGTVLLLQGAAYLRGRWVGWNSASIWTSDDGLTWGLRYQTEDQFIRSVTEGNDLYVAVGASGHVATSVDGLIWQKQPRTLSATLDQVVSGNGVFVASEGTGALWRSTDGVNWSKQAEYPNFISALAYGGGQFVAARRKDLLTSPDGRNWQVRPGAFASALPGEHNHVGRLLHANGSWWAARSDSVDTTHWVRAPLDVSAPLIVQNPGQAVISSGDTATLTVAAVGTALSYQWYRGSAGDTSQPIPGATGASYTTPPLTGQASYWVRVSNSAGHIDSSPVVVSMGVAPQLAATVTERDVIHGTTALLGVTASANPAPTYQWYRGANGDLSQPIPGATGASFTAPAAATAQRYWARATNAFGSADSATMTVTPWQFRSRLQPGGLVSTGDTLYALSTGTLLRSHDGINWDPAPERQSVVREVSGSGAYMWLDRSANQDRIWLSRDNRATWSMTLSTSLEGVTDLLYAANRFFWSGRIGGVSTWNNGTGWTQVNFGPDQSNVRLSSLVHGQGVFVGVGSDLGDGHAAIMTSSDGLNWTRRTPALPENGTTALSRVVRAGAYFFAWPESGGWYLRSVDGVTWTRHAIAAAAVTTIAWFRDTYYLGDGTAGYFTSPDGSQWTVRPGPRGFAMSVSIVHSGRLVVQSADKTIYSSDDGLSWRLRYGVPVLLAHVDLADISAGSGRFVISGRDGADYQSTDGLRWAPTQVMIGQQAGGKLRHFGGRFYATDPVAAGRYWHSSDGSEWTVAQIVGMDSAILRFESANNLLFALGADSRIAISPDGLNWTLRTVDGGGFLSALAHGNGRYVLAGSWELRTSTDLGTWTRAPIEDIAVQQIVFGQGVFVAVGRHRFTGAPRLLSSTDGINWSERQPADFGSVDDQLIFAGARFLVLGGNRLHTSSDGVNWLSRSLPFTASGFAVADGTIVAADVSQPGLWRSLGVTESLRILVAPESARVQVGERIAFAAEAAADGPIQYRWQSAAAGSDVWTDVVADSTFAGFDSAVLTIQAATLAIDGLRLRVVASGSGQTISTDPVVVQVTPAAPSITTPPQGRSALVGGEVTFSVVAEGVGPFSYQWLRGDEPIPGATGATLVLSAVSGSDQGTYSVTVANAGGITRSAPAQLEVITPPVIQTPPAAQSAYAGTGIAFNVIASGHGLSFQWRRDGSPIPGATSATLSLATLQVADDGDYSVTVSNLAGAVTTTPVRLTVLPGSAPVITVQPQDQTTGLGGSVIFTVAASGTPAPTYRWQRLGLGWSEWQDLTAANPYGTTGYDTPTLVAYSGAVDTNSGHRFRVVVSNPLGSVVSNPAVLNMSAYVAPTSVAAGYTMTMGIRADGQSRSTGANYAGQFANGTTTPETNLLTPFGGPQEVVAAHLGFDFTLLLKARSELWVAGDNQAGQLGDGTTTNRSSPVRIPGAFAGAAGGYRHSLFRTQDGRLLATGLNSSGQLGDGTTTLRLSPVEVAQNVVAVSAGFSHSLFVKGDGTAFGMGSNNGVFGNGTTAGSTTPVQIATNVADVAGFYHTVFLKRDGTVWTSGRNDHGQLGDGTLIGRTTAVQVATDVVEIAAGAFHTVLLKRDGTVWTFGDNERGQLGDGTGIDRTTPVQVASNVATISAGLLTTAILKNDGTLWMTGANDFGQIGDNTTTDRASFVSVASGQPSVPYNRAILSATVSDAADRVALSWTPSLGATYYRVWRHTTDDAAQATLLAPRVKGTYYEDTTANLGVTYRYWVQPVNSTGAWPLLDSKPGRRGIALAPPGITTPPAAQTVEVGADVTFTVVATGSAPLTYQWRKDGENIPGATAATLSLDDVTIAAAGDYDVVVSNAAGSATSTIATLTVNKLSQTITFAAISPQPIDGGNIGLTASASSGLPVQFTVISGPATLFSAGSNILVPNGTGEVVVRATQVGDATYAAAPAVELSLSITPPGHDAFAQAHLLVGGTVTGLGNTTWATRELGEPEHVPGAGGSATLWWKWTPSFSADVQMTTTGSDFDTVLAVYTGSSLGSLTLVAANDDRAPGDPLSSVSFWTPSGTTYYIAIDGKNGAKGAARLNIGAIPSSGTAPVFTAQPQPVTVTAGGTASFTINYTGQFPTTLFWQRRAVGSDTWVYVATTDSFYVTGTGISLTIRPLATMDGDEFRCVASNNLGTTYSDAAMLTVIETLDSWALEHFTEEELLDPAISGPNADPDGDGFANLLEYALGLDPRAAATSGLPEIGTANGELIYTYTRPVGRSELTYTVQFSTNLTSWTSEGVTHELVTTADGVEIWRGRVPLTAGPNLFLRLRVTR